MNRFFKQYHPFLPYLEPFRSPDQYWNESSLLFWSIVAVGARQSREHMGMLLTLSSSVTTLCWTTISSMPLKLQDIQAIILLCTWPFPSFRFSTDKSIILANVAVTSAMFPGMHKPGCEKEYTNVDLIVRYSDRIERTRTWVACVIVPQR